MTEKTIELNSNQELVLQWLKDDLKDDSDEKNTLRSLFYLQKFGCCQDNEVVEAHKTLNARHFMEVVKEFADWTLADHQPTFEVGEYYSYSDSNDSCIFKVTKISDPFYETLEFSNGLNQLTENKFNFDSTFAKESKPATAEQIAEFKRAEHFASKGRKLDEFRVGDKVQLDGRDEVIAIESIGKDFINGQSEFGNSVGISKLLISETHLIQTAEELQNGG